MKTFKLTKVKKLKGVGLRISYNVIEETAETKCVNKFETEINEQPSDDLFAAFSLMGKYAEKTMDSAPWIETEEVKLIGSGENESLIIKGKYYSENDLQGTIITPRMKLYADTFGIELEMQGTWQRLSEEVQAFIDGKRGETETFNAE